MNTNSTLKFIGYIEYKDLLDPETINKYDDNSVFFVKDIPANKSDRNVFINGIEINENNSIIVKINGAFHITMPSNMKYVKFTLQVEGNIFDIKSSDYTLDELNGIAKFINLLPDCVQIKGYLNDTQIINSMNPDIFNDYIMKIYFN